MGVGRKGNRRVDIPKFRTLPKLPQGPRMFRQHVTYANGPGQPPPGFINGQNSSTEWYCYWALAKIFDSPRDPRIGPFIGDGDNWSYQTPALGYRLRSLNSAVIDFVVHIGGKDVAIRVQTERFHIFTDSRRQAADLTQRMRLEGVAEVVDVYDDDIIGNNDFETGQKAIVTMKAAIGMIEAINPITSGTAQRLKR